MNQIEIDASELPEKDGDSKRISQNRHDIALFRVGEELRAIDNACPHNGASLSDGWIEDGVVACPWHAWQFDTQSGECISVAGCDVKTYLVTMQDGKAIIDLGAEEDKSSE